MAYISVLEGISKIIIIIIKDLFARRGSFFVILSKNFRNIIILHISGECVPADIFISDRIFWMEKYVDCRWPNKELEAISASKLRIKA